MCAFTSRPVHIIYSSSPSISSRRMGRSPLHLESASSSITGETTHRPSRLHQKRLQTWRARVLSLCSVADSRSLGLTGIIPTSSRPSQNGQTKFNLSRRPSFCPQTATRLRNRLVTNSRTPSNLSPSRSPTRPAGRKWSTARGCTGVRGRG